MTAEAVPIMNLLFDLDGTLADPFDAFASSVEHACNGLGLPRFSAETLRSLIGPPLHLELPRLLGPEKAELTHEFMRIYREHHGREGIYRYRFYPGMDEAMERFRGRHRVFVATSKPKVYADEIFRHFGKSHYFEFIYGSELSGVNSKKGDLIRFAMRESGLDSAETVMFGDRKHDVIGALENKISGIGVTWGYGSVEELNGAGASYLARSWDDLIRILDEGAAID
jgi:phosphoglycolate phosphatase